MLINLRNALMAGKRLPYDAEVEYLGNGFTNYQSGSTIFFPYIDVGVAAGSDVGVRITYAYTSALGNHGTMVCGSFVASGSGYFGVYNYHANNYKMWGGATKMNATINVGDILTTSTNFMSSGIYEDILNGEQINYSTLSGAPTFNTGNIWLFSVNKGSYSNYEISGLRIYSMQVSVGQTIVRDYIPVRKGSVGYLYDRVSRRLFGNAGTGDFVLGPDVVPVEYIESHGTEYIDIPVSGTPNEYFGIKGLVKIPNTSQRNKAVWDTEINRQFGTHGYNPYDTGYLFASWVGNSSLAGGWAVPIGTLAPFEVSVLGTTMLGVFQSNPRNITSAFSTLRLFGKYGSTAYTENASVAFGALTITDGLGIERKPFPVRVGTDATSWEGAMMDVLTRRIYRNAGTGAFTYGNDLKYPIPA